RLATWILQNQHRPIAVANQLQRPNGPRTLQMVLQSVFVRETIETGRPRALCKQPQRQHATWRPLLVSPLVPIQRAFPVLPQHLETYHLAHQHRARCAQPSIALREGIADTLASIAPQAATQATSVKVRHPTFIHLEG